MLSGRSGSSGPGRLGGVLEFRVRLTWARSLTIFRDHAETILGSFLRGARPDWWSKACRAFATIRRHWLSSVGTSASEVENYHQTLTSPRFFHDSVDEILILSNARALQSSSPTAAGRAWLDAFAHALSRSGQLAYRSELSPATARYHPVTRSRTSAARSGTDTFRRLRSGALRAWLRSVKKCSRGYREYMLRAGSDALVKRSK